MDSGGRGGSGGGGRWRGRGGPGRGRRPEYGGASTTWQPAHGRAPVMQYEERGRGGSGGGGGGRGRRVKSGGASSSWQQAPARPPVTQIRERGAGGHHGGRVEYVPVRAFAPASSASGSELVASESAHLTIQSVGSSNVGEKVPMKRPDHGGSSCKFTVDLLVNHFLLNYNKRSAILHYDIDVKPAELPRGNGNISKSDMISVKNELFRANPMEFRSSSVGYDGERNLYSAVELAAGQYNVQVKNRTYTVNVEFKRKLELSRLAELPVPRDVLQGLDVVLREDSSWQRIVFGRSFYSREVDPRHDLGFGLVAYKGYQQTLKHTEQGLVLCVDYSVLPFRRPLPVLQFLAENLQIEFKESTRLNKIQKSNILRALRGSKVTVTHRRTNQKYLVSRLTDMDTDKIEFIDVESERMVGLVDFYRSKYNREIKYKGLPCLDLSKDKMNYVPMEFCQVIEGQRYPKDRLHRDADEKLRSLAIALPKKRKELILKTITAKDGPCRGAIVGSFNMSLSQEMTPVTGRVLNRPDLRLGDSRGQICRFKIEKDDCQWNLLNNRLLRGQNIESWAILDFSPTDGRRNWSRLDTPFFIQNLVKRLRELGIQIHDQPASIWTSNMSVLSDIKLLYQELARVKHSSRGSSLQILICPMSERHPGYKDLKRICETELGLMTQCCLSKNANEFKNPKRRDQYFANLALKINAKLGGSNVELYDEVPHMASDCPYMFIGADVNHPTSFDKTIPSIAAVVGSTNFPPSTYATRFDFQRHRTERIFKVGQMCSELVAEYNRVNGLKPMKIVYFRDGVSDGQFSMVLNDEIEDIKAAIVADGYSPSFTVVVAKKRHATRLFPKDDNGRFQTNKGNVLPGTVVDTKIVDPNLFDFYLCSHYGNLGTSKPTHYYGLFDDHGFTSDELQKLVFNLCFTYAKCTKPISLVPPVYYADLAAYRARLYLECFLESQSHSAGSSQPASKSYGSLKLHGDVLNRMYYL